MGLRVGRYWLLNEGMGEGSSGRVLMGNFALWKLYYCMKC